MLIGNSNHKKNADLNYIYSPLKYLSVFIVTIMGINNSLMLDDDEQAINGHCHRIEVTLSDPTLCTPNREKIIEVVGATASSYSSSLGESGSHAVWSESPFLSLLYLLSFWLYLLPLYSAFLNFQLISLLYMVRILRSHIFLSLTLVSSLSLTWFFFLLLVFLSLRYFFPPWRTLLLVHSSIDISHSIIAYFGVVLPEKRRFPKKRCVGFWSSCSFSWRP